MLSAPGYTGRVNRRGPSQGAGSRGSSRFGTAAKGNGVSKFTHRNVFRPDGSTDESWTTLTCGHCGRAAAGAVVAYFADRRAVVCMECTAITAFLGSKQFPSLSYGPAVKGLPSDVSQAYDEARACMMAQAFTAVEMVCRKILMHVAVDKNAPTNKSFKEYVDYLEAQDYLTKHMKPWVDEIRNRGNEAIHDLPAVSKDRAASTLEFTAQLLRNTYEMEHNMKTFAPPASGTPSPSP